MYKEKQKLRECMNLKLLHLYENKGVNQVEENLTGHERVTRL